jgi:hypothetical protein
VQSKNEIRAGVRPQNPLRRSTCPGWYRQSSNAATIAFGMEIDVASYLTISALGRASASISVTEARGDYRRKP